MTTGEKVERAELDTRLDPTEGQKRYGNYKKGKVTIKGLKISIENPAGSIRTGIDEKGNAWESELLFTYGYFNGTIGKDGDPIDVFIGPLVEEEFDVYVIDQVEEETNAFDEHKVMFGFANEKEAKEAYMKCYQKNWKGFNYITTFSLSKFKEWIKNADAIKYPVRKLSMTSKIDFKNAVSDDDVIQIVQLSGEVIDGVTLAKMQKQAGDVASFDKLIVEIASPGGSVSEGLEIMVWLDMLSTQGKQIITVVTANAYSIASLIMLAADISLISKHGKVMVHNPMVPEIQYANANELEEYVDSLRGLETMMYDLYQIFTGLNQEQIKLLMDNETYLSPQEAVDYGFADLVIDIKPKSYEMATNIKKEINMSKTLNTLNKVIGMVNKSDFINQTYAEEGGTEVEIFQGDPATYQIGDRTSIESSGEDGIKLSDGSKLTIEDSVITGIDRAVEESEEEIPVAVPGEEAPVVVPEVVPAIPEEEASAEFNEGAAPAEPIVPAKSKDDMPGKVVETIESTKTTKETVAAEIKELSSWEVSVVNESFELGNIVEYKPSGEGEDPSAVGAGEYQLEDGRKILTNSEGIIKYIEPATAAVDAPEADPMEAKAEDVEAKAEDVEAKAEDVEAKAEVEAKIDIEAKEDESEKMKAMDEEMTVLRAELKAIKEDVAAKSENQAKFEDAATEAIDLIAQNTTSKFKPDAKSTANGEASSGSIFSRMKKKRGL